MGFRKAATSTFLLGIGVYIWLPTADEIIIHPILGLLFSTVFNINIVYGMLLSLLLYRGIGSLCIVGAVVSGGKPVYRKLRERFTKRNSEN
jgi:hypothetical protein